MTGILARAREALSGVRLPSGRAGIMPVRAPRQPRTLLQTATSVPAWVVRVVLALLCLAGGVAVASSASQWGLLAVMALVVAVRPHGLVLAGPVVVLAGMLAWEEPSWWRAAVLALVTHALLRLGAVADAVSWRGRVELGVLRDALPAFLAVQALAQVAVLLAVLLNGAPAVPWLAVVGVVGLAALVWWVTEQLRRA